MIATDIPYRQYVDVTGLPLDGGYLYFGEPDQNPETAPITVYWDAAGTQPAAQPIRTINGFAIRSGNAANIYSEDDYSLTIKNKIGVTVSYCARSINAGIVTHITDIFAAASGANRIGFIHTATGAVARTAEDKNLDIVGVTDFMSTAQRADVRANAALLDVRAPLQLAANHGDMPLPNGTMLIKSDITFAETVSMIGRGPKSIIKIAADFVGNSAFAVSPTSVEKRNWQFENFQVTNAGVSATNVFLLDIADAGQFLNKLRIKGVIADQVTGYFVELLNSLPNADGLFTGVFEDNWSLNGYYLDNIGDSMILQRNTTSGAGRGYYVNQLPGASHIMIRDGNCTSAGGVLIANAFNLTFENMQCECPIVYTGTGTGLITAQNGGATEIVNLRIRDNNINTNGVTNTTLACIYVNVTSGAEIDGNTLMCNSATGAHIVIGASARNTVIGSNKYYNQSGAEIAPIISDSGEGTVGIWKVATETTWTVGGLDFYKDRDGTVHLRGSLSGGASVGGQVITTLPAGFRPSTAQTLVASYSSAVGAIQISTAGVVTLAAAGQTSVIFDGITFSTK